MARSPVTASAATEPAKLAYAPLTSSQYGEAYVRNAIAAYERNSDLSAGSSTTTVSALADSGAGAMADPALAASTSPATPPAPTADRLEALLSGG